MLILQLVQMQLLKPLLAADHASGNSQCSVDNPTDGALSDAHSGLLSKRNGSSSSSSSDSEPPSPVPGRKVQRVVYFCKWKPQSTAAQAPSSTDSSRPLLESDKAAVFNFFSILDMTRFDVVARYGAAFADFFDVLKETWAEEVFRFLTQAEIGSLPDNDLIYSEHVKVDANGRRYGRVPAEPLLSRKLISAVETFKLYHWQSLPSVNSVPLEQHFYLLRSIIGRAARLPLAPYAELIHEYLSFCLGLAEANNELRKYQVMLVKPVLSLEDFDSFRLLMSFGFFEEALDVAVEALKYVNIVDDDLKTIRVLMRVWMCLAEHKGNVDFSLRVDSEALRGVPRLLIDIANSAFTSSPLTVTGPVDDGSPHLTLLDAFVCIVRQPIVVETPSLLFRQALRNRSFDLAASLTGFTLTFNQLVLNLTACLRCKQGISVEGLLSALVVLALKLEAESACNKMSFREIFDSFCDVFKCMKEPHGRGYQTVFALTAHYLFQLTDPSRVSFKVADESVESVGQDEMAAAAGSGSVPGSVSVSWDESVAVSDELNAMIESGCLALSDAVDSAFTEQSSAAAVDSAFAGEQSSAYASSEGSHHSVDTADFTISSTAAEMPLSEDSSAGLNSGTFSSIASESEHCRRVSATLTVSLSSPEPLQPELSPTVHALTHDFPFLFAVGRFLLHRHFGLLPSETVVSTDTWEEVCAEEVAQWMEALMEIRRGEGVAVTICIGDVDAE